MSLPIIDKVVAYLWREGQLLVFRQPEHPEAGLQVPAGTVEDGESLHAAVLRELEEETGLKVDAPPLLLGSYSLDMRPFGKAERHRRHIFALRYGGSTPPSWTHWERHCSDGQGPIAYALHWHVLSGGLPDLAADQGRLLPQLLAHIAGPVTTAQDRPMGEMGA